MPLSPDKVDEILTTLRGLLEGANGDVIVDVERPRGDYLMECDDGFRRYSHSGDWTVTIHHTGKHAVDLRGTFPVSQGLSHDGDQQAGHSEMPVNCSKRLREEGKPHPKSGCSVPGCRGVFSGCIAAALAAEGWTHEELD